MMLIIYNHPGIFFDITDKKSVSDHQHFTCAEILCRTDPQNSNSGVLRRNAARNTMDKYSILFI